MTYRPSADRLEHAAEQRQKQQEQDGTYYGSTTTGATQPTYQQPQYYGGTPTAPQGYAPPPPQYYGGTPTSSQGYMPPPPTPLPIAPSFDYSDEAIAQRAAEQRQAAIDELIAARELESEAGPTGYVSVVPEGFEEKTPRAIANRAYIAYVMSLQDKRATNLKKYPKLAQAAIEAGANERDVARLINYAEADAAAERVIAAMALIGPPDGTYYGSTTTGGTPQTMNDAAKIELGNRQIEMIMRSANPVMQMAIWDVVAQKIQEIEAPAGTSASSWADWIIEKVGTGLDYIFAPLMWANDTYQQAVRASQYGYMKEGYDLIGIRAVQDVFKYWDRVSEGNYDPQIVAATREEYGDLATDLVLSLEEKARAGDPDPLISLFAENSSNPKAMAIIQQLLYKDGSSDVDLDAVARSLENGNLGNTGQLLVTSVLGDEYLGTAQRGMAAGATNVLITVGADPTIFAAKVRGAYVAARFAIEKIAPGASRMSIEQAFKLRQTNRYFNSLFSKLDRYDSLLDSDPGRAAVFREQIRREFPELPDDVIDTLRTEGIRTTDDLAKWTVETNQMYLMEKGQVADGLIGEGAAIRNAPEPLAATMYNRGAAVTRDALLPRMSVARRARARFANEVSRAMPSRRGQAVISQVYDNTSDTQKFVETISDVDNVMRAGQIERATMVNGQPGTVGKKVDSFFKWFSSVGIGAVSIKDGRDAKTVYRYARMFLSRRHAAYWADRWRTANPSQRYDMLIGLNRTAAAAKGIDLNDVEALARVDELVTPTKSTTSFSARSPVLSLSNDTDRAVLLQERDVLSGMRPDSGGTRAALGPDGVIARIREIDDELASLNTASSVSPTPPYVTASRDEVTEIDFPGFDRVVSTPDGERIFNVIERDQLPETLFHVTTNADGIYSDGLIRVSKGTGGGLGGGGVSGKNAVSLTTSSENAERIADQLRFYAATRAQAAAGGTPDDLKQAMSDEWVRLGGRADDDELVGPRGLFFYTDTYAGQVNYYKTTESIWLELQKEFFNKVQTRFGIENSVITDQQALSLLDPSSISIVTVPRSSIPSQAVISDVGYLRKGENGEVRVYSEIPVARISSPASTPDAVSDLTIPSRFADGSEKALFEWQTAEYVALPNMRDMEKLGRWQTLVRNMGGTWGDAILATPQTATDIWSLGTLFGLRYSIRNSLEDLWFYGVITGGNLKDLYKGRRISTILRETRGRKRQKAFGGNEVQALGMVNRRVRAIGDRLEESQNPAFRAFGRWVRGNVDQNLVAEADAAARRGDFGPMRRLAAAGMAQARMTGLNKADQEYVLDLVDGPVGLKMMDTLNETGKTASSGGFANDAVDLTVTEATGVNLGALPRTAEGQRLVPVGDYTPELPVDSALPESFLYWERAINGVLLNDGPAGKIAVAYLDDPAEAVRRVAEEIRTDPTGRGYAWKFAALATESPEAFAARKVQAVRALFSDASGNLNEDLWRKVVDRNRTVRAFTEAEDGAKSLIIDHQMLKRVPRELRPTYVSGQKYGVVPNADGLGPFMDRSWGWMGEQYARMSREPIFLANYIAHRRQLSAYQKQLAEKIGEPAARRVTARMAVDRAYSFSLSYMDNPQNRSLMAYKIRNFSRYYRATEDFYRRIMRAGKNYPVGLWKTALIYDVLDDTGFVYTNENGEKYFMYPGTEHLMSAMNDIAGWVTGVEPLELDQPFILGGKVTMLAPSADPNQLVASLAGPVGTVSYKMLARRFPAMQRLDRVFLGSYGDTLGGSNLDAIMESILPAGLLKVANAFDEDERTSMLAAARADALKIAIANGAVPEEASDPSKFENSPELVKFTGQLDMWAWSAVITRFAFSLWAPASPQRFNNNVSDLARVHGSVDPRPAFLALVRKREEEGAENPIGTALADWFQMEPNMMPFTVSKTEWTGEGVRPAIKASQDVIEWFYQNREGLLSEYPQTAWYLAPQTEGFSWETWNLITAEGFRTPKEMLNEDGTPGPLMRDMFAAEGELRHNATVQDYMTDIEALDPRDPEQYAQIRDLEEQMSADLKKIREDFPWWGLKYSQTRSPGARQKAASDALTEVKRMVDELFASTPTEQWEGSAAYWLRGAIYTYADYVTEIKGIEGSDRESVQRKRTLEFNMRQDLNYIAEQSVNAELFVRNVLLAEPEVSVLDFNLVESAA